MILMFGRDLSLVAIGIGIGIVLGGLSLVLFQSLDWWFDPLWEMIVGLLVFIVAFFYLYLTKPKTIVKL